MFYNTYHEILFNAALYVQGQEFLDDSTSFQLKESFRTNV